MQPPRRCFMTEHDASRAKGHSPPRMLLPRLGRVVRSYADVARSPAYFPLWLSKLVSNFGDTLHYIALVVLVFQLTGSGSAVALLVAAEIIPVLLLGPIAGVVIDRFSRKTILIATDLVRAALALSLVWPQGAWHAYAVAAGLAAGGAFFGPTVQAVIPALTTDEQRLAANSVNHATEQIVQIVASAIAGGLIAFIGTGAAFGLNAATFAVSALLIARLPIPVHAGELSADAKRGLSSFAADARAGLAYARRDPFLSRLLIVQSLASFAVGATGAMLVVLSERHLRQPPSGFAWLLLAIGAGALLGPLIPNLFAGERSSSRWLFAPYVIRGVGDILIAVFASLPLALALLFLYGVNASIGGVVFGTALQDHVPDRMRGRVFTLMDMAWAAFNLLSLAVGALAVDAVGIRAVFWGSGLLLAAAGLIGLLLLDGPVMQSDQGH